MGLLGELGRAEISQSSMQRVVDARERIKQNVSLCHCHHLSANSLSKRGFQHRLALGALKYLAYYPQTVLAIKLLREH
jgi:hypothetical protein